jgi:hypothetical protein
MGRTEPTATGPTAPETSTLATLIGAAEAACLLHSAFGKDPFRTHVASGAVGELFGWRQLNAALAEHRLVPPRLRLERGGQDISNTVFRARRTRRGAQMQDLDPAALMAGLREGATLIVDAVNEISPPLQRLCAGLSAEFAASCQANLYASWGATQGFDVHWDDHEVFVLQLEGRKEWALYGVTERWPTRRGAGADAPRPETPVERFVLGPGEVLYLPRGCWHAAVGLGEPTLHLTVGLTRKSGADLLHWLADELLTEDLVRADLPFEAGPVRLGERVAELLARVAAQDPQGLAARYRRQVEAGLVQRPQLSFPHIGEETRELGPDEQIRLAAGPARLRPAPEGLVLSWRGVEFTVAPALAAPLRRLVAGEMVSLGDFRAATPGAGSEGLQTFLREMVRRGAFVIRGEGRA